MRRQHQYVLTPIQIHYAVSDVVLQQEAHVLLSLFSLLVGQSLLNKYFTIYLVFNYNYNNID